jgi:hypothetical protein
MRARNLASLAAAAALVFTSSAVGGPQFAGGAPPVGLAAMSSSDGGSLIRPHQSLHRERFSPDTWSVGYVVGEYQILSLKPVSAITYAATATGNYGDVTVSASAHLTPTSSDTNWYGVGCRLRRASAGYSGCSLRLNPSNDQYHLEHLDAGSVFDFTGLGQTLSSPADKTGTHQFQLTCSGSSISGWIDGTQIASVQDSTYQSKLDYGAASPRSSTSNRARRLAPLLALSTLAS